MTQYIVDTETSDSPSPLKLRESYVNLDENTRTRLIPAPSLHVCVTCLLVCMKPSTIEGPISFTSHQKSKARNRNNRNNSQTKQPRHISSHHHKYSLKPPEPPTLINPKKTLSTTATRAFVCPHASPDLNMASSSAFIWWEEECLNIVLI